MGEKVKNEIARTRAKDVAAFNLKTCLEASDSELQKARRATSAKAYIFKNRPLTPARFQKQQEYSSALGGQVESKASLLRKQNEFIEISERQEQEELQNEIDSMKEESKSRDRKKQAKLQK